MNYHDHNDAKGREARERLAINRAERAKAALPFEGTLYMLKHELKARREAAHFNWAFDVAPMEGR